MNSNTQIAINQIDNGYIVSINKVIFSKNEGPRPEKPTATFCETFTGVVETIRPCFPDGDSKDRILTISK